MSVRNELGRYLAVVLLALWMPAHAGNIDAGRSKSLLCVSCHGAEGVSDNEAWPNLAGQNEGFLIKQIKDYRAGRRSDPWMSPMAMELTDQEIEDLAAYLGSLGWAPDSAGAEIAEAKLATCVACHGANGIIDNDLWPNLAGQNKPYLVAQMKRYREAVLNDPLMSPVAKILSDQDIEDLATFYSGL
jgi:cytochrome c553